MLPVVLLLVTVVQFLLLPAKEWSQELQHVQWPRRAASPLPWKRANRLRHFLRWTVVLFDRLRIGIDEAQDAPPSIAADATQM